MLVSFIYGVPVVLLSETAPGLITLPITIGVVWMLLVEFFPKLFSNMNTNRWITVVLCLSSLLIITVYAPSPLVKFICSFQLGVLTLIGLVLIVQKRIEGRSKRTP